VLPLPSSKDLRIEVEINGTVLEFQTEEKKKKKKR